MRKIQAAVIGLGGMGETDVKTLVRSDVIDRLVGVDLLEDRCRHIRDTYGIATFRDVQRVWADPRIELVYITTSNQSHVPLAIEALRAGKKVMMEKPLGVCRAEVDRMLAAVRETQGFLQVGFELRYSGLYRRMKEILDSGEIGRPRHIHLTYTLQPFEIHEENERWRCTRAVSGGIYAEKLCHYVDLPRWWVGSRVRRFFSVKAPNTIPYYEIPDNCQCTYEFEDGTLSHLTFMQGPAHVFESDPLQSVAYDRTDYKDLGHVLNYIVVGTEGAMESALFHRTLKVYHHPGKPGHRGNSRLDRVERWEKADDHRHTHNTSDQNLDIARRVAAGLPPALDPEDAAETMRLCFEFEEAAEAGWKIVER